MMSFKNEIDTLIVKLIGTSVQGIDYEKLYKTGKTPRECIIKEFNLKETLYRLYDKDNVFLRETKALTYVESNKILKATQTDKIFAVEDDGHEVLCGSEWVKDLLDL